MPISQLEVRELATHKATETMISCYLDVDGRRLRRPKDVERELERVVRDARTRINGNNGLQADLDRITKFVRSGFDRTTTRGLAIFACDAQDYFEVVPLPVPVPSQVIVSSGPATAPLEAVVAEQERLAVVLVDRHHARLCVVEWGELTEQTLVLADPIDPSGDDAAARDRAARAVLVQHAKRSAEAVWDLFKGEGFVRLVLGGNDDVVSEVERDLHAYVAQRCCGRLPGIAVNASAAEVRDRATEAAIDAERRRTSERTAQLREHLAGGTRGVAGLGPVLAALAERRVEQLLVSRGFAASGWQCTVCAAMALRGPCCQCCDAPMERVHDVVAECIDRARANGCVVDICVDDADLDVLGRIGALLRF